MKTLEITNNTVIEEFRTKPYTWGKLIAWHEIGPYLIAEYKEHIFENSMIKKPVEYAKASTFHPFIDGNDTNHSFNSLDAALAGAIAYRAEGPNHHADGYFMKMIEI